jgi:hypothetical protein
VALPRRHFHLTDATHPESLTRQRHPSRPDGQIWRTATRLVREILVGVVRRIALVVLGLYWSVCGAVMALNPPPPGFRRSASLPIVGWLLLAAALYLAASAALSRDPSRWVSGDPARHAPDDGESGSLSWGLAIAAVGGVLAAVWSVWYGVTGGYLSMVGLGSAVLPLAAVGVAYLAGAWR